MKSITLGLIILLVVNTVSGQIAINNDGSNADSSSMLDVKSNTKGMLIPRLTIGQRDAITSPAIGLMVYQIDGNQGFYFYNGYNWEAVGTGALYINDLHDSKTSGNSIFIGTTAGANCSSTDNKNVGVGTSSLYTATTGSQNTAVGYKTLFNTNGHYNTAMGYVTLQNNSSSGNSAFGTQALVNNTTGAWNNAFGYDALFYNTSGTGNVSIGINSLHDNTSGNYNTAVGYGALYNNTTADSNTAVGFFASGTSETGINNTVIGCRADFWNIGGSSNTIIGHEAGKGASSHNKSGNVFLGFRAGYGETGSNKLYIENSADITTPLIYGEFNNNFVTTYGNFGIGTKQFGNGTRALSFTNGTVPNSSITDGVMLYSEDGNSTSELKVRDEAGNVTTLSPHNFNMTSKSEPMAWSFYSENHAIGQKINVDMLRTIRLLEKITGEKLVYIESLSDDNKPSDSKVSEEGVIQKQQEQIDRLILQNIELIKRIEKLETLLNK